MSAGVPWSAAGRAQGLVAGCGGTRSKCRSRSNLRTEDLGSVGQNNGDGGGMPQVTRLTTRRVVQGCNARDDDVRHNVVGVASGLAGLSMLS